MFQKYNLSAFTFIYFQKVLYLGSSVSGFKGTMISYNPSEQAVLELFHIMDQTPQSLFLTSMVSILCCLQLI